MLVATLQQFLRSLIPPLESSGASSKVLKDIQDACTGLEPFKDQTIQAFATLLAQADEYYRTGVLPVAAPGKARAGSRKKDSGPAISVEDAILGLRTLYDRATAEDITYAHIDAEVKKLDKLLKADELFEVAIGFGLAKPKSKKAALEAIGAKIKDLKQSHERTEPIRKEFNLVGDTAGS